MSSPSMKYHELASVDQLYAYKNGQLSGDEAQWVEQLIADNPMVAAVAENIVSIDLQKVKAISARTQSSITKIYMSKVGFWTKYSVWIGLSSILLLIGLFYFYNLKSVQAQYTMDAMTVEVNPLPGFDFKATAPTITSNTKPPVQPKENIPPDGVEKSTVVLAQNESAHQNKQPVDQKQQQKVGQENMMVQEATPQATEHPNANATSLPEKTVAPRKVITSKYTTLAVQKVQILSKLSTDAYKSSNKNNGGSPFQSSTRQSSGNTSYSLEDVPQFAGGDWALRKYFVGKLRPIKVLKSDANYDRNVRIQLEINSRGKLKDYTIFGHLYPAHQSALKQAIENLPRFSKGKVDVVYSIGISF